MNSKISDIIDKLKEDVLAIVIYGSILKDYFREDSDIDICIIVGDTTKIKDVFRKILLLMQDEKLDIKIFDLLPLYLKGKILKEGKFVYIKDHNKLFDYIYPILKVWEDDEIAIKKVYKHQ